MKKALWLDSINQEKIINFERLKGGVSSEVYKIRTKKNYYCVKRSLKKLLVKKKWIANTNRIKFEFLWLQHCKKILSRNIPKVYEYNSKEKYILMEYLNENKFKTLKDLYFREEINFNTIKLISNHLFKIHSKSSNVKTRNIFKRNNKNFFDLRLDPYFNEVGKVYPKYKKYINSINQDYYKFSSTLVHGDFSPKNILVGFNKIIYLDAECCNYGDPVFDLVFFSNHLLIKSLILKNKKKEFIKCYEIFYNEYLKKLSDKKHNLYLNRIIKMTPVMLLARIDGKSPVEYINDKVTKNIIRQKCFKLIASNIRNLNDIMELIYER